VTATFSLPVGGRGKKALADFEDAIRVAATVPRPDWERLNSSRSGAEEPRLAEEVRKILGDASLRIDAWCGEVPCPRGIEGNVSVDTEPPVPVEEALERFRGAPGLRLREGSPAPGGGEGVEVGPVRAAGGGLSGLRFGVTCDNLLKGSALNAVQIAEQVFKI
jgi:aspartate-semialdehyde dehydrogenase